MPYMYYLISCSQHPCKIGTITTLNLQIVRTPIGRIVEWGF